MTGGPRLALALVVPLVWTIAGCRTQADSTAGDPKPPDPSSTDSNRRAVTKPDGPFPSFRTVGAEAGFDFERYDDMHGQRRILEVNGGGVALFDFDRDGWLDVFMTNGCRLPLSLGDRDSRGEFFRNRGRMQFQKVTSESSLVQFGYTHGCAVGDYDADGFDDLYVTALGRNAFWRNNGDGTFADITESTDTEVPQWSSSAAFADLNGDGHLDLYVVNYLDESDESPTLCPNPQSPDGYGSCSPALFEGVDDVLFLADGTGAFIDATAAAGVAGLRGKALGVVVSDLDKDSRPEIYVANDGEVNFLFTPAPEGEAPAQPPTHPSIPTYQEHAQSSGIALNERGHAQASMGIAAGDYDGNGTTDLFLTHFFDDTNTLYSNRGGLAFEDATRASNLGPSSRTKLGWGTVFIDPDNDGWLDLFVANGHINDRTWMSREEPYHMRPQIYRNEQNGSFTEVTDDSGEYFQGDWLGRGVAAGDLDRDGRPDLVISHQLAPSVALRNETQTRNRSLVLRLVGTSSNRNGYCARVELVDTKPAVVRELAGGGSFQAASAPEVHLGIGNRPTATIRIRWPSGHVDTCSDVEPGTWLVIEKQAIRSLPLSVLSAAGRPGGGRNSLRGRLGRSQPVRRLGCPRFGGWRGHRRRVLGVRLPPHTRGETPDAWLSSPRASQASAALVPRRGS